MRFTRLNKPLLSTALVVIGVSASILFSRVPLDTTSPIESSDQPPLPPPTTSPFQIPSVRFTDITQLSGINFVHTNGAFGKKLLPETIGSGVAFIDYDNDRDQDLLFINSCNWPGQEFPRASAPTLALYRNQGDGAFTDVTMESGLAVTIYGMGVTVGDYDNDGWPDLFVTAVGGNHLFHNERAGHGSRQFREVTGEAGVGGQGGWPTALHHDFLQHDKLLCFSSSATFLDYDGDCRLDLFVCNYLTWSPTLDLSNDYKVNGVRTYGPPFGFDGAQCCLYRNIGSCRFQDVTAQTGILVSNSEGKPLGKALGVVACDADDDGWPDVVVANDGAPNFFFHNENDDQGGRRFTEKGYWTNVAFGGESYARAGMGIDWGEYQPGRFATLIGNFSNEPSAFLSLDNRQQLLFSDIAERVGIARPSRAVLTFGVFFFDYDLDGRQDLLTCNGHLSEELSHLLSGPTHQQPVQLYWNTGVAGTKPNFVLVASEHSGPDLFRPIVGRGCAFGDINGDGNLDVVLTEANGPARLLRNEGGAQHNWLRLVLQGDGENSNRSSIGAQVIVEAGGIRQHREVTSGRGYLSQSELTLTFGLNKATTVDLVTIKWPGRNARQQHVTGLEINREHVIRQE